MIAINPEVGGHTPEQLMFAVVLFAVVLIGLSIATYRLRWHGLDDEQRRHKKALAGEIDSQNPGTVRIAAADRLDERRDDIRRAWDASGAVEGVDGPTEALQQVGGALRETWRPYLDRIPPVAQRALALGILSAVFGAVAVSTQAIVAALQSSGSLSSPLTWPVVALSESAAAARLAADILGTTPGASMTWALVQSAVILTADWLYSHWYVAAGGLITAGLLAWVLLQRVEDPDDGIELPTARTVGVAAATITVGIWGAVLAGIAIGRLAGSVSASRRIGAGVLVVAALVGLAYSGVRAYRGVQKIRRWRRADRTRLQRLDVVVRVATTAASAAVAPMVVIWAGVSTTKLPTLVGAWVAAPLPTQVLTLLIGVGAVGGLLWSVKESAENVGSSLHEVLSRRSVQAALFARGLPWGVVVLIVLLASALGLGTIASVLVAAGAGIVARLAYRRVLRIKYGLDGWADGEEGCARVTVHAYPLEDGDGQTHYYARVNGHALAHPDREAAVDAIVRAGRDVFDSPELMPMVERTYAEDLLVDGITDIDRTRRRLDEGVVRTLRGRLGTGDAEVQTLEDDLDRDYPTEVWESTVREWRRDGRLRRHGDYYRLGV